MKKLFLMVMVLTFFCSLSFAQEVKLTPYGVSPYMVTQDTVDLYFDSRFPGIANTGVGTKMYLKCETIDTTLTSAVWAIIQEPSAGAGSFGTTKDMGTSAELITFVPSEEGTYKLTITDGTLADTIVINASKYMGTETTSGMTCATCHSDKYDKWEETGHSDMLVRGLDGTLSSHYNEGCISCHTVGYDPNADNDGFDDFDFVYPDTLFVGQYDNMMAAYPDAMKRANIQCESCHGPGAAHMDGFGATDDAMMVTDISTENCAYCHDDGHYHVFPDQWNYSKHASGSHLYNSAYAGGSCAKCHNGQGFINFVDENPQFVSEKFKITCATCHDPHDATNAHQLRILTNQLANGQDANVGGNGVICMNCHESRRDGIEYVEDYLNNLSSHYGPHYGTQTDMLYAANTYTWGEALGSSAHLSATENACVDCHMTDEYVDLGTHTPYAGGHTFSMVFPDGTDNVAACEPCHGNVGEEFSDKKFFYNGSTADLDGNGTAEGLQIEIQGLLDMLAMLIPPVGSTDINTIDSSWTLDQAAGFYNWEYVAEDRSLGVHNPVFAYELLVLSITKNGGVVSVPDGDNNLPTEFNLAQNYPNPFNPSTTIEFSLPEQADVKVVIYDALGNELDVLFSGSKSPGIHRLNWNASNYASGIYFYKMNAGTFTQVKKMLLLK